MRAEVDIKFIFEQSDIITLKSFYDSMSNNTFVMQRKKRNIEEGIGFINIDMFWDALVAALLTTRQRSGPNSDVLRFLKVIPFPLTLSKFKEQVDTHSYVVETLSEQKGIQHYNKIAKFLTENYEWLNNIGWKEIDKRIKVLIQCKSQSAERDACKYLAKNLKGVGPKQSRNILQMLGLTKYEIPLDSRITKWLNDFGFPIKLSEKSLQDTAYYEFVNDAVIQMCKLINIYPCEFDAAVFASYDGDGWDKVVDSKW